MRTTLFQKPFLSTAFALILLLGDSSPGRSQETAAPSPSPTPVSFDGVIEDLNDFIPREMDKGHVKGLTIALVAGDKVVWVKGFGYANLQKNLRSNGDTLYHVGAVSKIFTAAEILKMADDRALNLDRPLRKILPAFSINSRFEGAKPITPRALLSDHSGLPGFFLKGIWVDHPESLEDFVQELKSDYLVAPPQTLYKYSYVDYDLLGRIVELKNQEPFAQALKDDLFDPLGMDSSSFDDSSDADPRLAQGYRHGEPVSLIHLRDIPAAGMVSSANDLARFLQFVLGGSAPGDSSPLSGKSLQAMFTPAYPDLPLDFGHEVGLGWQLSGIDIQGAEGVAWHDGEYPPYNAEVAVLEKQGMGLVLLSNSAEGDALQGDVTERALKLMLHAKYGIPEELRKKKVEMPKTVEVPEDLLEKDAGIYSALGQLMKIAPGKGRLTADFQGHQMDLLPVSQDTFVPHLTFIIFPIDLPQFPLTFSTAGGQDVAVLGGLTFPVPLEKIQSVDIPQAWKDREGAYELQNPDGEFLFSRITLGEKEGFLTVDLKVSFPAFDIKDQEFKVALVPLSDEDAVIPGLFYGDGGTIHAGDDGRAYYSGYWFVKKPGPGTPEPQK